MCSPASQAAGIINDSAFVVLRLPLETRVFASGRILGEAEGRIWKFARLRSRPDSARHRLITCGACRARLHIYSIGPRIDRSGLEGDRRERKPRRFPCRLFPSVLEATRKRAGSIFEASSVSYFQKQHRALLAFPCKALFVRPLFKYRIFFL